MDKWNVITVIGIIANFAFVSINGQTVDFNELGTSDSGQGLPLSQSHNLNLALYPTISQLSDNEEVLIPEWTSNQEQRNQGSINQGSASGRSTPTSPSTAAFRQCYLRCPQTTEYNPVCGSNGVTYDNRGQLECARRCGLDVTYLRPSSCPPPTPPPSQPTTIIDNPTTTPSNAAFRQCFLRCPQTTEYNPVCGSNGVTYDNRGRLECARRCGLDVTFLQPSSCPPSTPPPSQPTTIIDNPTTTPSNAAFRQCYLRCPLTTEYNPVCGSNGVTYDNRGQLECARRCGLDVTLQGRSPCPPPTASPQTTVTTTPIYDLDDRNEKQ